MNIPPSEADALSLWKYQALIHNWNDDGDVKAPDHEHTQKMVDRLNAHLRQTAEA